MKGEARVQPTSPDFEEITEHITKIGILKNPHMHSITEGVGETELKASLKAEETELQELLDFQKKPFNNVIIKKKGK